jgi:hypothetical protein
MTPVTKWQTATGFYRGKIMERLAFLIGAGLLAAPAHAGAITPSPEAGAGMASLALLAAGYAYLRKRKTGN